MKIHINDGKITATPETKADVELLLQYANQTPKNKKKWRRECPICQKMCKGKKGLSAHTRLAHPENKIE